MQTYRITRWNAISGFDGTPPLSIDCLQWSPPVDVRAEARLCWDETAIYVSLSAYEKHIRATHFGRTDMVCEDSCLEFFLRPNEDDLRYFNFEFNKNCALYLGFGSGMHDLVRLLPDDADALFAPCAADLPGGWEIRYRVPASFIARFFPGFTLEAGRKLRGNCYKCGDLTVTPHYLSWNPMRCDAPAFHRPEDFGAFLLV